MVLYIQYNDVVSLEIDLREGSVLTGGVMYADIKPVVYYGSSITQGSCASGPGNAYQNIISALRNIDHINLGFSGSARGEDAIVDYMAGLDMSVFVCDYDHNAPTAEHLEAIHEKLYRKIREKNPDLPIIFITKPDILNTRDAAHRREIIYKSYRKAYAENSRRTTYIDGSSLFPAAYRDYCTVDACHPNDIGFLCMAEVIGAEIDRMLRS